MCIRDSHDTGMVTMKTQRLSEFDLHVRAFLELPITQEMIDNNFSPGASHVILANAEGEVNSYQGVREALTNSNIDVRIFGKSETKKHRRMGVVLAPSLKEAKEFVRTLGIKHHKEWNDYCKSGNKPDDIPSDPWIVYREWKKK